MMNYAREETNCGKMFSFRDVSRGSIFTFSQSLLFLKTTNALVRYENMFFYNKLWYCSERESRNRRKFLPFKHLKGKSTEGVTCFQLSSKNILFLQSRYFYLEKSFSSRSAVNKHPKNAHGWLWSKRQDLLQSWGKKNSKCKLNEF